MLSSIKTGNTDEGETTGSPFDVDIEEQEADEQTVRDKAYRFQTEEVQMLRRLVKEGLEGYVEMLRKKDSDFAKERQFFLNQANLNE
jgi:hypothetical protein